MGETLRRTGPYSRTAQLARPKRRTPVSRFLQITRDELIKHVGGNPTVAQKLIIERIAMALLRIELMDKMALNSHTPGEITERQSHDYLAWVNTAGRLMERLDRLKHADKREPTNLQDYLSAHYSSVAAE